MTQTSPKSWDPLEVHDTQSTEIVTAASKREIRNILKSYVGFYDPFSELIQNSLDAVDARKRSLKEEGYKRKLWITIDLQHNQLSVTDNGIGFKEAQFRLCLSPSISFKNAGDTRGNKGVGATYLAYGFNYLQLGTKTPEYANVAEINNGREWVDDDTASVARPIVKDESTSLDPAFAIIDRGSTFTVVIRGNVRPKTLDWIGATTAEQWKTILLIKTPLGQIRQADEEDDTTYNLTVLDKKGVRTELLDQKCRYILPHTVIKGVARVSDILTEQRNLIEKGKDPSKLPMRFTRLNGVYDFFGSDVLQGFVSSDEDKALIRQHQIWAYGFFCYSVSKVLDKFNDQTAKLRAGQRILRGGMQLATNAMPQGELIMIPLTSNTGYQNQSHVVVHFAKAEPDLGRKGFQPELQKLAERLSSSIVNRLKVWRHLMLTDKGPGDSHQDDLSLDEWISSQKEYEKTHPISLKNENFFAPTNEISISAAPNSEQDVIALFNQLIAGGVIRGIQLMASSSHKQYDGLYRFHLKAPLENHIYDKEKNPLGIQDTSKPANFQSRPYVLEFKYSFDDLIVDFENEEKSDAAIDLAVVWTMGTRYKERFQIVPLLLDDNLHLRQFHGVTHELVDDHSTRRMHVIVLEEMIQYLNEPENSQVFQRNNYLDND